MLFIPVDPLLLRFSLGRENNLLLFNRRHSSRPDFSTIILHCLEFFEVQAYNRPRCWETRVGHSPPQPPRHELSPPVSLSGQFDVTPPCCIQQLPLTERPVFIPSHWPSILLSILCLKTHRSSCSKTTQTTNSCMKIATRIFYRRQTPAWKPPA